MHRLAQLQTPQRQLILISLFILCLGCLISCDNAPLLNSSESPEPSTTIKALNRPASAPIAAADALNEDTRAEAKIPASSTSSSKIDLAAIIGTDDNEWLPQVIAQYQLQRGMSPEDVGKILPGAERISEFGFSEVVTKDVPGINKYKFSFLKEKKNSDQKQALYSISLLFDPSLKADLPYDKIALAFAEKYGEIDSDKIDQKIVTWVGPHFATAQLTNSVKKFEGYEFKIVIPNP